MGYSLVNLCGRQHSISACRPISFVKIWPVIPDECRLSATVLRKNVPREQASRIRHQDVKRLYESAVRELAASRDPADRYWAHKVNQFTEAMPAPMFPRNLYKDALEHQLAAKLGRDQSGREDTRGGPDK